jgi:hypothetical protein
LPDNFEKPIKTAVFRVELVFAREQSGLSLYQAKHLRLKEELSLNKTEVS